MNTADPGNGFKPLADHILGIIAKFKGIARVALNGHGDDGIAVGVGFGDHWRRIDILWKALHGLGNFVADVISGSFKVFIQIEFDGNIAASLNA